MSGSVVQRPAGSPFPTSSPAILSPKQNSCIWYEQCVYLLDMRCEGCVRHITSSFHYLQRLLLDSCWQIGELLGFWVTCPVCVVFLFSTFILFLHNKTKPLIFCHLTVYNLFAYTARTIKLLSPTCLVCVIFLVLFSTFKFFLHNQTKPLIFCLNTS